MKKILSILLIIVSISAIAQNTLPDPPIFKSASVIPESTPTTVKLTWIPSDSADVAGYIVYKIVDNITTTLDTITGRETSSFEYTNSSANTNSEKYRLASYDTEGYKSSITDPHTTIFLQSQYDKCAEKATLTWSQYSGWGLNIANYRVYRRFTGTDYQLVKTLSATDLQYEDDNLVKGRWYCYYIEAVNTDGTTATSNSTSFTATGHEGPISIKAKYASVNESNHINLNFEIVPNGQVIEYQLLRSTSIDDSYNPIESFPYSEGQNHIIYTDVNIDASQSVYYYKLVSIDPCGQISQTSNIASNILLTALDSESTEHKLNWTEYKEWENGVFSYKIYSYFDNIAIEIGNTSTGYLDFQNDIASYVKRCHNQGLYLTNKFCYYVEAYENSSNMGLQNISRSNIACVYESPVVWVPNAFNITSLTDINREFKPILSFVKKAPYEFLIYNRWGQLVFKTNDITEGWSGKDAKEYYHTDYYVYKIKYVDYKDKEYSQTGTFYLLME